MWFVSTGGEVFEEQSVTWISSITDNGPQWQMSQILRLYVDWIRYTWRIQSFLSAVEQCYPKCRPQTSSIGPIWELVRIVLEWHILCHIPDPLNHNLREWAQTPTFYQSPPGDSDVPQHLRSTECLYTHKPVCFGNPEILILHLWGVSEQALENVYGFAFPYTSLWYSKDTHSLREDPEKFDCHQPHDFNSEINFIIFH